MQEYTVEQGREQIEEVVELVATLPNLTARAHEVTAIQDAMEGALELVEEIPAKMRFGALAAASLGEGWLPLASFGDRGLAAGIKLHPGGDANFAVRTAGTPDGLGSPREARRVTAGPVVEYFSAREALRHALTGSARLEGDLLPAPEENGTAARDAAPKRGAGFAPGLGRGSTGFADAGDGGDVAEEGLDQPEGGVRYLGVGLGALAGVSEAVSEEATEEATEALREDIHDDFRTVRPDWRVRGSALVVLDPALRAEDGGRLAADAWDLARRAEERAEDGLGYVPTAFLQDLNWLRRQRAEARLTAEDHGVISGARSAAGEALPAHDLADRPEVRESVVRLVEACKARLLAVGGEVLLVPAGVSEEDPRLWEAARGARAERLTDAEILRRSGLIQAERRAHFRLLDDHHAWSRREALRARRPAAVDAMRSALAALPTDLGASDLAPLSPNFLIHLGRAAEASSFGELLEGCREAYRDARAREEASRTALDAASAHLHVTAEPWERKKWVADRRKAGRYGLSARLRELSVALRDAGDADGADRASRQAGFFEPFEVKQTMKRERVAAFLAPVISYGGKRVAEEPELATLIPAGGSAPRPAALPEVSPAGFGLAFARVRHLLAEESDTLVPDEPRERLSDLGSLYRRAVLAAVKASGGAVAEHRLVGRVGVPAGTEGVLRLAVCALERDGEILRLREKPHAGLTKGGPVVLVAPVVAGAAHATPRLALTRAARPDGTAAHREAASDALLARLRDHAPQGLLAYRNAGGSWARPEASPGAGDAEETSDSFDPDRPETERESGPDPAGATAPREYRDASREGEAAIATATGKVLAPSARPRRRERARQWVGEILANQGFSTEKVCHVPEAIKPRSAGALLMEPLGASGSSATPIRRRALSLHLAALPVEERLALYLALEGPKELAALEGSARDPEGLVVAARALYREGRVRFGRGWLSAPALGYYPSMWLERVLTEVVRSGACRAPAPASAPAAAATDPQPEASRVDEPAPASAA